MCSWNCLQMNYVKNIWNSKMEGIKMKYVCDVCGWIYDETVGDADLGIAPGTKFEELPEDFLCPLCSVGKDFFSEMGE